MVIQGIWVKEHNEGNAVHRCSCNDIYLGESKGHSLGRKLTGKMIQERFSVEVTSLHATGDGNSIESQLTCDGSRKRLFGILFSGTKVGIHWDVGGSVAFHKCSRWLLDSRCSHFSGQAMGACRPECRFHAANNNRLTM